MDRHHRRQLRELWRRHQESQATLGIVTAGIAALFIAGIVAAFIYAKDTNPTQSAQPRPTAPSAPAETTGSGGTGAR
jgi:hypothetical protein